MSEAREKNHAWAPGNLTSSSTIRGAPIFPARRFSPSQHPLLLTLSFKLDARPVFVLDFVFTTRRPFPRYFLRFFHLVILDRGLLIEIIAGVVFVCGGGEWARSAVAPESCREETLDAPVVIRGDEKTVIRRESKPVFGLRSRHLLQWRSISSGVGRQDRLPRTSFAVGCHGAGQPSNPRRKYRPVTFARERSNSLPPINLVPCCILVVLSMFGSITAERWLFQM